MLVALLAIGIGLISFPILLILNIQVMNSVHLAIVWCGLALISSSFEETFWPRFLLDETAHLPKAFGVIYSTILLTQEYQIQVNYCQNWLLKDRLFKLGKYNEALKLLKKVDSLKPGYNHTLFLQIQEVRKKWLVNNSDERPSW